MSEPPQSKSQTVLVTGGSSGIGLELARCFAMDGYNLVLAARSAAALEKAASELSSQYGIQATAIASDLGAPGGAQRLIDDITRRNSHIDVLVNNAGYGAVGAMENCDVNAHLGMIDLNVRALTELTRAYWPNMIKNRRGGVLNVSSMGGFAPGPFMAIYGASKAYVLSFSEALWEEARGTGLHVSCLCPGATRSDFHQRAGTDHTPAGKVPMMSAAQVARIGYRAFQANKRVAVPGVANKLAAAIMHFIPNGILMKTLRRVYGG